MLLDVAAAADDVLAAGDLEDAAADVVVGARMALTTSPIETS